MRGDRRVNRFHLGNIRLYLHDRRTRRYSPYVRTQKRPLVWTPNSHRKFIEVAKELGGFDNVTAFSVWEIMKAEVDGVSPTLNDASSVLGMLQFMFPEYTISPPPMVTFYMNVKSEVGSYEAMVSYFGKLKLAPRLNRVPVTQWSMNLGNLIFRIRINCTLLGLFSVNFVMYIYAFVD